jgi:hypothetical protein
MQKSVNLTISPDTLHSPERAEAKLNSIRNVPASNFCPGQKYFDKDFSSIFSVNLAKSGIVP